MNQKLIVKRLRMEFLLAHIIAVAEKAIAEITHAM
jgi:hypothetical protein